MFPPPLEQLILALLLILVILPAWRMYILPRATCAFLCETENAYQREQYFFWHESSASSGRCRLFGSKVMYDYLKKAKTQSMMGAQQETLDAGLKVISSRLDFAFPCSAASHISTAR